MAGTIKYPKYQTYFHRGENTPDSITQCHQCGKEITENSNCLCPQCGAYIGEEMYHECDSLVEQVISGYVESDEERKEGSLSDETFEDRMKELEQVAGKAVFYIKELESYSEKEYKTAENKYNRFNNSLLYRIPNGLISLLFRLAGQEEEAKKGVHSASAIVIGFIFGILGLTGPAYADGFFAFIEVVIGLLFISIPIAAIASRVLCRPLERWYGTYIWMHGKKSALEDLCRYYTTKKYNDPEQGLTTYIAKCAMDNETDLRPLIHGIMQETDDKFESIIVNGGFLMHKCAIIVCDYTKETKGELPQSGKELLENAKREWRSIYVQYEA